MSAHATASRALAAVMERHRQAVGNACNGAAAALAKAGPDYVALPAGTVRELLALAGAGSDLLAALRKAERFVAGFEGCELQEGIDALLTDMRAAIAKAETGQ